MPDEGFAIEVTFVLLLILLNGFFAGTEIAIVTARVTRLRGRQEKGSRGAAAALRLKQDPDRFLATVQVGVTLVSTMASALGGVAASERLEPAIALIPLPWLRQLAEPIAVGAVVLAIAYLSLVVGELVPKSLAIRHAETIALFVAPVIEWISRAGRPAVALLTASSRVVLQLLGQRGAHPVHFLSLEDLRAMAEEVARQGEVSEEIVTGALSFHERDVREVMTPRPRIAALAAGARPDEALRVIRQSGHSRYPVYSESLDEVVGFVHARDVYEAALAGEGCELGRIARPVIAVPAGKPATALLEQMRRDGAQMALVVDEHGSTEGLVTMEDLLEVIVGEIEDEHRVEIPRVRRLEDGRIETEGSVAIHELNDDHQLELPESPAYVTVAGLVLQRLGHIPVAGESVEIPPHRLTVRAMEGRRVARLLIETAARPVVEG